MIVINKSCFQSESDDIFVMDHSVIAQGVILSVQDDGLVVVCSCTAFTQENESIIREYRRAKCVGYVCIVLFILHLLEKIVIVSGWLKSHHQGALHMAGYLPQMGITMLFAVI